jgi:hypothetical protein
MNILNKIVEYRKYTHFNDKMCDWGLLLLVFVSMTDPSNSFFGLKNIAFGILLLTCIFAYKVTWKPAWDIIAIVYAIISISIVSGYLQGFTFDIQIIKFIYKTYVFLFLLLWINKLSFLEKMLFPALIIACITIIIYGLLTFYPTVKDPIYMVFNTKFHLIGMSERTFIGVDILGIYYTSVALLILPFTIYLYRALFKEKKRKYYYIFILLFITLLFSGTRACMLSAVFLLAIMVVIRIYKTKRGKLISIVISCFAIIGACKVVYQLLNDTNESSLVIKMGHIESYKQLIVEHPLILFLGQGAGSQFYSKGFGENTAQTEWSYAEFIRWFGVIGGGIIIFIYFFPLYILYKKRKILPYSFPLQLGYLFYLAIAGTNPLLLGSNGLLALLVMYSYAFNPKYEQA